MSKAKYIIGIDLGTTNSTMAYSAMGEDRIIQQFKIPQIISSGVQDDNYSLPSFLYFPLEGELHASVIGETERPYCVGIFARDRGAEMPNRTIHSAKSWLCHSGIDRRAPILPLLDEESVVKMSPLDACSEQLRHLKESWDSKMDAPFCEQQVLVTVPASFDPSARQLVQEAAAKAGFPEIVLLEEPQAAFYAWLAKHENDWRKILQVNDCVLVVDIGGGTTDFSLVSVQDREGDLHLERIAVGAHLLLGGDNIDFGLAHQAKAKLEEQGHSIDDWQLQALVHQCRKAKESLLSENPPKQVDLHVQGRGSKLIGGSLKTQVTLDEIHQFVVDGFVPLVSTQERSLTEHRLGIQQVGLPFAQDPRISCQLAKFLAMTGESESSAMDHFMMPTAVLFNGGTMKADALRQRFVALLNDWAKSLGKPAVKILPDVDYDFAVSCGAVHYGLVRNGQGVRIKSGTSRSYYIGVEDAAPAIPGVAPPLKALCVAPFGMEEGSELQFDQQEFALVVGEPATFRFFSRSIPKLSNDESPQMGTAVKNWKTELTELHPIEAMLDKMESDGKTIRVKLRSRVTELGMLEVWCVAPDERKWKLEFDVRENK